MSKKAFVLVDYTIDFVANEGKLTVGEPGQKLETAIVSKIKETIDAGGMVFAVNDLHLQHDVHHPEHQLFPPHNIEGTDGRKLYGEAENTLNQMDKENPGKVVRLDKRRYSAFCGTPLELILRQEKILEIELAGVCTDICIFHTAVDAYNKGFKVTIDESAVDSFNQEAHVVALDHFESVMGFEVKRRG